VVVGSTTISLDNLYSIGRIEVKQIIGFQTQCTAQLNTTMNTKQATGRVKSYRIMSRFHVTWCWNETNAGM
jgi:hypothetical protein